MCEPDNKIQGILCGSLARYRDQRGWLLEIFRADELPDSFHPAMAYVSQTEPGTIRGPHEHVDQSDYFVFAGPGDFELFLWDRRESSPSFGVHQRLSVGEANPMSVLVPPGVVHAYRNVSDRPGWVFNAPNRLYAGPGRSLPVDEIRWEDRPDNPYRVE